ncbi:TRAF interacting protein no poles [Oratosquilla oratoria]|uniref:TRAF interacting protein no poles n=1 Tax=Oratosquilla oratoria TaxID=337810 RepID=UPI003F772180
MRAACVICSDLFVQGDDVSATPCGHTFHSACILQWIERSKSCPQCRHKATGKNVVKLYFDSTNCDNSQELDPVTLQHQVDNLKFQIRLREKDISDLTDDKKKEVDKNKGLLEEVKKLTSKLKIQDTAVSALKTQLQYFDGLQTEVQKSREEAKTLRQQLQELKNVEKILAGTSEEVDFMLESYGENSSSHGLATFCAILKKEMTKAVDDKKRLREEARASKAESVSLTVKLKKLNKELGNLKDNLNLATKENESLRRERNSLQKKIQSLEDAITSPSGDVRNSALHRLITESPAPEHLKKALAREKINEESLITPEVVRTMSKMTESDSPATTSTAGVSSDKNMIASSLESSYSPVNSSGIGLKRPLASSTNLVLSGSPTTNYTIFKKKSAPLVLGNEKNSKLRIGMPRQEGLGYDGLGGHHQHQEFPKPKPTYLKKKKAVRVVCRNGGNLKIQASTLKDYLKCDFDSN